jgi:hypothetical protein
MDDQADYPNIGVEPSMIIRRIQEKAIRDFTDFFRARSSGDDFFSVCITNQEEKIVAQSFSFCPPDRAIIEKVRLLAVRARRESLSTDPDIREEDQTFQLGSQPIIFSYLNDRMLMSLEVIYGFAFCVHAPFGRIALDIGQTVIARARIDYLAQQRAISLEQIGQLKIE